MNYFVVFWSVSVFYINLLNRFYVIHAKNVIDHFKSNLIETVLQTNYFFVLCTAYYAKSWFCYKKSGSFILIQG